MTTDGELQRRADAKARQAAIAACGQCDELGWLIIGGRAHRCPHPDIPQDTPQPEPANLDRTGPKTPPASTETD